MKKFWTDYNLAQCFDASGIGHFGDINRVFLIITKNTELAILPTSFFHLFPLLLQLLTNFW